MKKLFYFLLCLILLSCASEKKLMTSWLGNSKKNLVLKWGPPKRIASDGGNGEIYIYETNSMFYNTVRYNHRMFYVDKGGKIYSWRTATGPVPARQINLYIK